MTQKLLTLPFRLGFGAARTALDISTKTIEFSTQLAGTAVEVLRPGGHTAQPDDTAQPGHPTEPGNTSQTEPSNTSQTIRPARESRVNGHPAPAPPTPARPDPVTPPDEQPDTPLTRQQDAIKTLPEDDQIVAEFAESGAEEGAGAQLNVEEPWPGYAEMNAGTVIARIDQADAAELALAELYEQTHKKRQTVLKAAAKRLRALSPPNPE